MSMEGEGRVQWRRIKKGGGEEEEKKEEERKRKKERGKGKLETSRRRGRVVMPDFSELVVFANVTSGLSSDGDIKVRKLDPS